MNNNSSWNCKHYVSCKMVLCCFKKKYIYNWIDKLLEASLDNETGVSMEKYIYFMCNKDVTLVLTDDYYFYFGLKQLTGLPLVYITYEGSMDKPIVIKQKRNIRVLVDSRIFLFREMGWL